MNILVIEDDRRIASFLERGLTAEGYQVSIEQDGRDGLDRVRNDPFELVTSSRWAVARAPHPSGAGCGVLDRMLPYVDGLEVCRVIREERLPVMVLMLTAKDSLQDKIDGLKGGADDYLTKPFAFDELLARIVALRRRGAGHDQESTLRVGSLVLDPDSRRVIKAGAQINLTVREFELLRYLMVNVDRVVSRQRLLNSVWEYGFDPGTKIVDVYVRYLRKKIDDETAPSLIQTVRGVGYMVSSRPDRTS